MFEMYQLIIETIDKLAWKIHEETNYSYAQIYSVIKPEYVQICNEAVSSTTLRFARAMAFLVRAGFLLLLGIIFYVTTKNSISLFFISGFIWNIIFYFSAPVSPFFRKVSQETIDKAASDATNVMIGIRIYLIRGERIASIVSNFILQTLGFWAVNGIMTVFGIEYLGFKTAVYFGISMSVSTSLTHYFTGRKYYQRVKKVVVKKFITSSN